MMRGFTLVELLIVLIIIGIAATATVANVGESPQRSTQREALKFQRILTALQDEAVFTGEKTGLILNADGYEFVRFDGDSGQWLPVEILRQQARELPLTILSQWVIDGDSIRNISSSSSARRSTRERARQQIIPDLQFLVNGEMTPFKLTYTHASSRDTGFAVSSDGLSNVQVKGLN